MCFPVIGLITNYYSLCLVFNATVFFLWNWSYNVNGKIAQRHILLYLSMIVSFLFYRESALIVYTGALMHGIATPFNLYLYSRKSKWIKSTVFIIPLWMFIISVQGGYYFVAYWDLEIMLVYGCWMLGFNKEITAKALFTISFGIIAFAFLVYDVCANTGL